MESSILFLESWYSQHNQNLQNAQSGYQFAPMQPPHQNAPTPDPFLNVGKMDCIAEIQKKNRIIQEQEIAISKMHQELLFYKNMVTQLTKAAAEAEEITSKDIIKQRPKRKCESPRYWTPQEHQLFLEGLEKFGRSPQAIAEFVKTRTPAQVKSHAQKYWIKVKKEQEKIKKQKQVTEEVPEIEIPLDTRDHCNERNQKRIKCEGDWE